MPLKPGRQSNIEGDDSEVQNKLILRVNTANVWAYDWKKTGMPACGLSGKLLTLRTDIKRDISDNRNIWELIVKKACRVADMLEGTQGKTGILIDA